jgi:hypothetical protein
MRGLTIRHRIRRFLKPYDLTVGKFTSIVNERQRTDGVTDIPGTASRFFDFTSVDFNLKGMGTGLTTEESNFHVGYDWSCSDDETFDAYKFVGICVERWSTDAYTEKGGLASGVQIAHIDGG